MPISKDLFLAILAMDSYNRGYDATKGMNLSDSPGTLIGTAAIKNIALPTGAQAVGFYAVAYQTDYGTVISYRGTDKLASLPWSDSGSDIANGWILGAGNYGATQAALATQFLASVTATPHKGDILLTGHSLGGGLAGFLSQVYGNEAMIFDPMSYQLAADELAKYLVLDLIEEKFDDPQAQMWADLHNERVEIARKLFNPALTSQQVTDQLILTLNAKGYFMPGEMLDTLRWFGNYPWLEKLGDGGNSPLGFLQLHKMDLAVIQLFSDENGYTSRWLPIHEVFLKALFDEKIAKATGAEDTDAMRTMIAYSAIEEGTRPFGDTAIRSLFNDAVELGDVMKKGNVSRSLESFEEQITQIFVQYAGQLANGKVLSSNHQEALDGVLSLSEDKQTLLVNFSDDLWKIGAEGGSATKDIIGREDIIDELLSKADPVPTLFEPYSIRTAMKKLWDDDTSDIIDRIAFAVSNDGVTTTLEERKEKSDKATLFVGGDGPDTVTGSSGNDMIFGGSGDGADHLHGGGGDDILIGGLGDDFLYGDDGDDYLLGGAGFDTYYVGDGDTIIDSDGKGQIYTESGGTPLSGPCWFIFYWHNERIYYPFDYYGYEFDKQSPKDQAGNKYELNNSEDGVGLDLTIHLAAGGKIVVRQWSDGDCGIFLYKNIYIIHDEYYIPEHWPIYSPFGNPIGVFLDPSLDYYSFDPDTYNYPDLSGSGGGGGKPGESAGGENAGSGGGTSGGNNPGNPGSDNPGGDNPGNPGGGSPGGGTDPGEYSPPGKPNPDWYDPGNPFQHPPTSPLVLDLDGDGLDIISLADSGAYFDLNENGFAEKTAWIGADDGFLALDINGNGRIDDLSELFGGKDVNGFIKLSIHDLNGDGVIDINDPVYKDLLVWRDADGDGLTDAGELVSLESLGVTSINLDAAYINKWVDGNWISHRGQYVNEDGSIGVIDDIWFKNDQLQTIYRYGEEQELTLESLFLPELVGYGTVKDLSVSMAEDAELNAAVKALISQSLTMSLSELRAEIKALLLAWTGADDVAPGSRGGLIDARHLAFLEAMHGQKFVAYDGTANPGAQASAALEKYYQTIISSYVAKFLVQLPLAALFLGEVETIDDHPLAFLADITYSSGLDRLSDIPASVLDTVASGLVSGADSFKGLFMLDVLWTLRGSFGLDEAAFAAFLKAELGSRGVATAVLDVLGATMQLGANGNDTILGGAQSDAIAGGHGDDILNGGQGNDAYFYTRGDGHDTITEAGGNGTNDRLVFIDINPEDVTLRRYGSDVILLIAESFPGAGDAGSVVLKAELADASGQGVEQIVFADGTIWTQATLRQWASSLGLTHQGTDGDDTLTGTSGNDALDGGAGDDILKGDYGSDSYRYGAGYGNDTVIENGSSADTDVIRLQGLNSTDVTFSRFGDNLLITINATGEVLKVQNHFLSTGYGVEQVVFADGTMWDRATIQKEAWHRGGAGDDTLIGSLSNDILDGGAGDDILKGDYGSDSYRYGAGYGNDTVIDIGASADIDVIRLVGLNSADVTFSRFGDNLLITINATGEVLKVQNHFLSTGYGVEQVVFADGTVWDRATIQKEAWHRGGDGNDTLIGSTSNDILDGGAGDDILKGDYGSDTYRYGAGYGNDTVIENGASADIDVIRLQELNSTDVIFSRTGNHLLITIDATGEVLKVQDHFYSTGYGIEQVVFADGTTWDRAAILQQVTAPAPAPVAAGMASFSMFAETSDSFTFVAGVETLQADGVGAMQLDNPPLFELDIFPGNDVALAHLEDILAQDHIADHNADALHVNTTGLLLVDDFRHVA